MLFATLRKNSIFSKIKVLFFNTLIFFMKIFSFFYSFYLVNQKEAHTFALPNNEKTTENKIIPNKILKK